MKLVLQRVERASVAVAGEEIARIGRGLLVLIGVEKGDAQERAEALAVKTAELRIFADENGKMNRSCLDIGGEVLVVSQFTLAGDCSRGRRPGFDKAAPPELGEALYLHYAERLRLTGLRVATGLFGADMQVELVNDGPVTFIL
ncbi:MAG: D-tyrosyl-tRNA(Tyr) deacylase [Nitrospinaceae bacterium]|nr:MAG: D-tyrosyl-tRNA(Tyr) deacylase [Nitrospinaceae bacterium]